MNICVLLVLLSFVYADQAAAAAFPPGHGRPGHGRPGHGRPAGPATKTDSGAASGSAAGLPMIMHMS